jgi:hypothetical protein
VRRRGAGRDQLDLSICSPEPRHAWHLRDHLHDVQGFLAAPTASSGFFLQYGQMPVPSQRLHFTMAPFVMMPRYRLATRHSPRPGYRVTQSELDPARKLS